MRFKASIHNVSTFTKFTASLASLGPLAWVRFSATEVRFTVVPEVGTQVWAVLNIETIFEDYTIQSAAADVINLEVPLASLLRALRSATASSSASIRLTKKDGLPLLALTVVSSALLAHRRGGGGPAGADDPFDEQYGHDGPGVTAGNVAGADRETVVTQEVPVRVLSPAQVHGVHEPRCREPDVHVLLPPLAQLKAVSDRFTRLAAASASSSSSTVSASAASFGAAGRGGAGAPAGGLSSGSLGTGSAASAKLEMSANMHGCLRLSLRTDAMRIVSLWTGLANPELDPGMVEGGEAGVAAHPSTRMKALGSADGRGEEGWATVRVDGRDWGKVMSVGRLGGRVIACFCDGHALILYVYLSSGEDGDDGKDDSVLTYYVTSYSA